MDILHGKKACCFIALPHHNHILVPVMQALQARGVEVMYITAAAEAAFEITLNEAGLAYRHALDYATPEIKQQLSATFRTLRPVWQEKILSSPTLQAIPLPVQDKIILSTIENLFCFQHMFEVEKPDVLFALHEVNSWGKILGYLSHALRIPYITFQEGGYYGPTLNYRFLTDYSTACAIWGDATKDVLLAAGCGADKLFPVGHMDLWQTRRRSTDSTAVATTRSMLGIGQDKKVVLLLMSHVQYASLELSRFLDWQRSRQDIVVIFKWHPATGRDVIETALKHTQRNPACLSLQEFDIYALLGISDVCVVVGNSTTGMEALAFDKPLIEIRVPDKNYSFSDRGVAELVQGFDELSEPIDRILGQGITPQRQDKVDAYLAHYFGFRDDKTVDRVVAMTAEMIEAKALTHWPALPMAEEERFACSVILPVDDSPLEAVLSTIKGLAAHVPPDLFEVRIVNAATRPEVREVLASLEGDVRIVQAEPGWSFSACCNQAAIEAQGKYLAFLKPGLIPCPGWLEGLLKTVETQQNVGLVGERVCHENGLIWHIGLAFDINQSPFSLYRLLPTEFSGTQKPREFKAREIPFLMSRALFCRLGGFSPDLTNRFEDIDLCLRLGECGQRILYTPESTILHTVPSWEPTLEQDRSNRIRFFARWAGSVWQDDDAYLQEDGLDHDRLSALYREFALRVAAAGQETRTQLPDSSDF